MIRFTASPVLETPFAAAVPIVGETERVVERAAPVPLHDQPTP